MFPVIICVAREQNSEVDATFTVLMSVGFQCTFFRRRTEKDQRNGLQGIRMGQISTMFSENEKRWGDSFMLSFILFSGTIA